MSLIKPSIFDTTTFDLTITGLDRTAPDYVGVATGFTDVVYEVVVSKIDGFIKDIS